MYNDKKESFLLEFGNRVKKYRNERGFTLEELAHRIGYTSENARSSVQKIEAGKIDPPASKIRKISEALNVPISVLMGYYSDLPDNAPSVSVCEESTTYNPYKSDDPNTEKAILLFLKLDSFDQGAIIGRMETMLENEKYSFLKNDDQAI